MRTGIIRCVSFRAFADALSCSNSRLFAVRQFDRSIALGYELRIPLHFSWCKACDWIWLLRKCCSLNSALKHESRIVRVWVQMWLGRWAKGSVGVCNKMPQVTEANFLKIREVTFWVYDKIRNCKPCPDLRLYKMYGSAAFLFISK